MIKVSYPQGGNLQADAAATVPWTVRQKTTLSTMLNNVQYANFQNDVSVIFETNTTILFGSLMIMLSNYTILTKIVICYI